MPHSRAKPKIRYGFIRFVYILTAIIGTITGVLILLAPDIARKVIGFPSEIPPQQPVVFGLVGAIWLSIALLSLMGLRAPLKFLPLLMVQLIYKTLWFAFVFTPLVLRGEFPDYGMLTAIGNAIYIALDIRAIPFRYMFRRDESYFPMNRTGLDRESSENSSDKKREQPVPVP